MQTWCLKAKTNLKPHLKLLCRLKIWKVSVYKPKQKPSASSNECKQRHSLHVVCLWRRGWMEGSFWWTILPLLTLSWYIPCIKWYFPQFSAWMGKPRRYNNIMVTSLIPLSSSLIAPYANCLQHECVKHSNSTIILNGNIDSERTFFIAPLGKWNQIKPHWIC